MKMTVSINIGGAWVPAEVVDVPASALKSPWTLGEHLVAIGKLTGKLQSVGSGKSKGTIIVSVRVTQRRTVFYLVERAK